MFYFLNIPMWSEKLDLNIDGIKKTILISSIKNICISITLICEKRRNLTPSQQI